VGRLKQKLELGKTINSIKVQASHLKAKLLFFLPFKLLQHAKNQQNRQKDVIVIPIQREGGE